MEVKNGYKQTEAGIIPNDWIVKSIGELSTDMLQGINTAVDIPEYVVDGIPMLKANNIIDGIVNFQSADHISHKTYKKYTERYRLKKDDFLFSNIGARLGTGSLLTEDIICTFAWNVMRIIPNKKLVTPRYLACLMNSPSLYKQIKNNESGSGMGFVPKNILQGLLISLPASIEEQTAIATALSDADALISSLEKLIAKKHNIKQGAMQRLLQPKEGWEVKKLGEVASLHRENIATSHTPEVVYPYFSLPAFDENKMPVFEVGKNILSGKYVVPQNSILISKLNPRIPRIWMPEIVPNNSIASTEFLIFVPKPLITREYLFTFCCTPSFSTQMELSTTGTTGSHQRVNPNDAMKIEILFPADKVVQMEISSIFSEMNQEVSALEAKLEKYKQIKQGMMQQLLTGKIRLL